MSGQVAYPIKLKIGGVLVLALATLLVRRTRGPPGGAGRR
jgi:hypothetical protein